MAIEDNEYKVRASPVQFKDKEGPKESINLREESKNDEKEEGIVEIDENEI